MNKKILYSFLGLAILFFIVSLFVFLKSNKDPRPKGHISTTGSANITAEGPASMEVRAFFFTESSEWMQPVSYELKMSGTREEKYRQFFDLLMKERAGYIIPIPEGVTLRSIYLIDAKNMMVLDFSDDLLNNFPSGTQSELEFVYFFVNNICYNFSDIKKVKILISGNEYPSITGHVDFERPFFPDFSFMNLE